MANAMVTFIFQISDATPIIRLLIRVISGLKVNFNYLWDLAEISDATPIGYQLGYLTPWIFIYLVRGAYLFHDFVWWA